MQKASVNGIEIGYDTFGDSSSEPLLLIMGIATQMIYWEEDFCKLLADKGHYVIRFDNRDVGLSTKFDNAEVPDIIQAIIAIQNNQHFIPPYTMEDMANDAFALLDYLGVEKAHFCGMSMGGMIAQLCTIMNPSRVLSLTSIMSSTGEPGLPGPTTEVLAIFGKPYPSDREEYINHSVNVWKTIGGPGFQFNEEKIRRLSGMAFERSYNPPAFSRHFCAILANGSRKAALSNIKTPTLVIHGADDPLVRVECGKDTAESIKGSELFIVNGMGHHLPEEAWPEITERITAHIRRV